MTEINIKKITAAVLATAAFAGGASAYACTGVYVGKKVSADGSVMIARTEDMMSAESKRFIVHPAEDHEPGKMFRDAYGLELEYPAHTYRYSCVPGSAHRGIGEEPFGEAGFNELGVAATSTITAYPNENAIAADPYTENGLYELSINDIILSRAATAREGIELVADIVDKHGSGEGNSIMVADANEAWYMEMYTGHQYAAIKLPEDKAAVIPNTFMLGEIDLQSEDVIVSEEIESLPKKEGFLKKSNGRINLRDTYGEGPKESNSVRIWGGRRLLHGSVGDNTRNISYDMFFTPKQKITLKEVMDVTRSRYEGTRYDANLPENKYVRVIGTSRQEECHVLQIRPNMPVEQSCVQWLCMGNSEFTAYVPYYAAAITDTPYMFKHDSMKYDPYSMYWASRSLSTLCGQNRELYGNKVKSFFSEYENNLIKYLSVMDAQMKITSDYRTTANRFCKILGYDIFNKTTDMYNELIYFLADFEGKDEFEDNTFTFEPEVSTEIDNNGAYVTSLPTIVTMD